MSASGSATDETRFMATLPEALVVAVEHHKAGRIEQAETIYREILQVAPDQANTLHLLGVIAHQAGKYDLAAEYISRAISQDPAQAEFHYNLALARQEHGKRVEAVNGYWRVFQLNPGFSSALNNLGNVLRQQGQIDEVVCCYRQVLQHQLDNDMTLCNLVRALEDQVQAENALASFQQALQQQPDNASTHSSLLFAMQYLADVNPDELQAAHISWDARHGQPLMHLQRPFANDRDPERSLRVGFVSPDLGYHPVGIFLALVLEHLNRERFQTFCYSNRPRPDGQTERIRLAADVWREIRQLADDELADQIRRDQIDILFDLTGHTDDNRLPVFARKPAPVQITWMGYVGTTGLTAMDYLLADRFHVPADAEPDYQEHILRLPDGYLCYEPLDYATDVGPLPALSAGHVTFGCFNNPCKVNQNVLAVWADLLSRLPSSHLVLMYKGFDQEEIGRRIKEILREHNVDIERVDLLGNTTYVEHLASYNCIDVVLDPFPYSGGLTTCEALWMGVPVVTCPGSTFAGRHVLSHLSHAASRRLWLTI